MSGLDGFVVEDVVVLYVGLVLLLYVMVDDIGVCYGVGNFYMM